MEPAIAIAQTIVCRIAPALGVAQLKRTIVVLAIRILPIIVYKIAPALGAA